MEKRNARFERLVYWALGLCLALFLVWGIGWIVEPVVKNHDALQTVRHLSLRRIWVIYIFLFATVWIGRLNVAGKGPFVRLVSGPRETNRRDDGMES
jgi:hypothetical protein